MTGSYSQSLVAISLLVAILASYTRWTCFYCRRIAGRVALVAGWRRGGDGPGYLVDAFHRHAGFDLPIPVGYDLGITLYSLAVSIGASAYALWLVSRPSLPWRRLAGAPC
jgi:NO-binding membrane sensor protein with MHYT domain